MEFTDSKGVVFPWSGEKIEVRISGYAVIERHVKETNATDVLMVNSKTSAFLELPGGGILLGELRRIGVARECMEEIGVEVKLRENPFFTDERGYYDVWEKKFYHSYLFFYLATIDFERDLPPIPADHLEIASRTWLQLHKFAELKDRLHPICRAALQKRYLNRYGLKIEMSPVAPK